MVDAVFWWTDWASVAVCVACVAWLGVELWREVSRCPG